MRLLLVEDDPEVVAVFQSEFAADAFDLVHVATRDESLEALAQSSFDIAVCDLRIPSSPAAFDADLAHGRAVLMSLIEDHAGTPVIAFSAYGTVQLMQDLLHRARQEDFLGEGRTREMLTFFSKDQLTDCVGHLHDINESIAQLHRIEIATGVSNLDLSWEEDRILRVYARRLTATVVRASALTGGLSGSRVLRLRLEAGGAHVASVVVKLNLLEHVIAEQQKVEMFVAPVLPSGAYPSAVTLVRCGAGGTGGLFYSLAGRFDRSLFDALQGGSAAEVVMRVRALLKPWLDGAPVERMTLGSVRECLIEEADLPTQYRGTLAPDEGIEVSARKCTGHFDLHVFNVLLDEDNGPIIIDFAAVNAGPASIDPVSLELSLVFHPDARGLGGSWPSAEQAENWDDLDRYSQGCPDSAFVAACRQWAFDVAAGDREVFASLYSYGLRQLKFTDTPHNVALALVQCARRRLGV